MKNNTKKNDKLVLTEQEALAVIYVALGLTLALSRLKVLSIKG